MIKDLADGRSIADEGDQLAACAAVGALECVDGEDAFQKLGPRRARDLLRRVELPADAQVEDALLAADVSLGTARSDRDRPVRGAHKLRLDQLTCA